MSRDKKQVQREARTVAEVLSKALEQINGDDETVYDPDVIRTGDKIIVPEGANLDDVIYALREQRDREMQTVEFIVSIPVSPWDGAYALQKALKEDLGITIHKGCRNGCCPPTQIDVEVDYGKTISIPWGRFILPSMESATLSTDTTIQDGRVIFQCQVYCERRFEDRLRRLLDKIRSIAVTDSLHRGKAFSIAFNDARGNPIKMPSPKFFELTSEQPIFRADLTQAIERNVFIPIRHAEQLALSGHSLKRGVAFVGQYGVGKTLLASHIAKMAIAEGWTFIYVKNSAELPAALRYAVQYQPVVVFAEDIDRIAGAERTDEVNELLNQLDGIDGKAAKIMTILTSNHADRINPAMRRPGRIDLVMEVHPPDEETVGLIIRSYAENLLEEDADLTEAQKILAGQVPARIREAVSRARLESLRRTSNPDSKVNGDDLAAVANEVMGEIALFSPKAEVNVVGHQEAATFLRGMADSLSPPPNGNGQMKREVADSHR